MKIKITADKLAHEDIGHGIPVGTICEGWYEDDGFLYAPNEGGIVVLLSGEYEVLEDE